MTKLSEWMTANEIDDAVMADRLGVSRVSISRIRRGLQRPSPRLAADLARETGIPAWDFIKPQEVAA